MTLPRLHSIIYAAQDVPLDVLMPLQASDLEPTAVLEEDHTVPPQAKRTGSCADLCDVLVGNLNLGG